MIDNITLLIGWKEMLLDADSIR